MQWILVCLCMIHLSPMLGRAFALLTVCLVLPKVHYLCYLLTSFSVGWTTHVVLMGFLFHMIVESAEGGNCSIISCVLTCLAFLFQEIGSCNLQLCSVCWCIDLLTLLKQCSMSLSLSIHGLSGICNNLLALSKRNACAMAHSHKAQQWLLESSLGSAQQHFHASSCVNASCG